MKLEEVFPITINITEIDIKTASIYDVNKCIGAKTLKRALKKKKINLKNYLINWGKILVYIDDFLTKETYYITTKERWIFTILY